MNLLLLLYLLFIAPKLLLDRVVSGKRHPGFLQRIGWNIPSIPSFRKVIWIHAVSVGEAKAVQSLLRQLKEREADSFFLITTTTATGQEEARRSLQQADAFAYLPLDFSWVVNRWVRKINPQKFILVESDFWPSLLTALKKQGTQISLVSGKLSAKSASRFLRFPFFSRKLFSLFDHICVQNEEHFSRFKPLVTDLSRLHITGNLKLDLQPQSVNKSLDLPQPVITVSCTHPEEEELILDELTDWFLILAPRHPERFEEVALLLTLKNIPFTRWSSPEKAKRVLLMDAMGQLPLCYSHSQLAIVGGSYVDHIGGHNLFEPLLYSTPVFFGPYTDGQKELVSKVSRSGAGMCVPLSHLKKGVAEFFSHPTQGKTMKEAAQILVCQNRGAVSKTLNILI